MENKFNSQNELYKKLMPALRTKKHELICSGVKIVKEADIWNYNKEAKWRKSNGLTLASMVDDILNTENKLYEEYVVNNINRRNN